MLWRRATFWLAGQVRRRAAAGVQVNQLNGGRITNGAIERELPTQFGTGNTINLQTE